MPYIGSQDVVRVSVEVLAGSVIAHRGARIGMAGSDLDVPQVDPSVQHGCDEGISEHVWVGAGGLHSGGFRESPQAPCCCVPVHTYATAVEQDEAAGTAADGLVDGPPTAGGSGIRATLVPLPHTRSTRWPCSSPRSAMSAPVASKIRRPSSPSIATSAKSHGDDDWRAAVSKASNCRWVNPRVGDRPRGLTARPWSGLPGVRRTPGNRALNFPLRLALIERDGRLARASGG
jgi:hypothetical protein